MVYHYRETDPVSARWTANTSGVPLSSFQGDENIYSLDARITATQAMITASRGVVSITASLGELTFHMSDSTAEGPFAMPVATFLDRGTWAPSTAYSVNDTFNINGTLYRVIFAHTSALTFSAGANDGMGHNYYSAMISSPASGLPTGGATDYILGKSSGADFAVSWRPSGMPRAGSNKQVLKKTSGSDYATSWGFVALSELSDVELGTPSVGDLLMFSSDTGGNNWENVPQSALSIAFTQVSGVLTAAQLPFPTPTTIGGVESIAAVASNFLTQIGTDGSVLQAQPAFSDISGVIDAVQSRPTAVTALGTTGTVSLDPTLGDIFTITPTGNVTLNAASAPAGARITVIVTSSGTSSFSITPSANFKSTGALATGTVSGKTFAISFAGNGTNLVETGRTAAM